MTALAQCLCDLGKSVAGADVAEDFVTASQLALLPNVEVATGFEGELPPETEVVIYSGAHGGQTNPLVQKALARDIKIYSHAQALGELANLNPNWAICGANGKTTTTAMLAFCLEKMGLEPSYAVGVGEIKGLERIGRYTRAENFFVVEADEYAEDVTQIDRQVGLKIARFHYLLPETIIIPNLSFDHPDVYRNLAHTQEIFGNFMVENLRTEGILVANADDENLRPLLERVEKERPDVQIMTFGQSEGASLQLNFDQVKLDSEQKAQTVSAIWQESEEEFELSLGIPGLYNLQNAAAALTAMLAHDLPLEESVLMLREFTSTRRRFEILGEINQVLFIDDYAHHPDEIEAVIAAARAWYPGRRLVVAFQSHTYSRTKALFHEFAQALAAADQILMIDIFPSAREPITPTVTSDELCATLNQLKPSLNAINLHTIPALADYCRDQLQSGDLLLSLGAGDIYHFWDLLSPQN